VNEVAGGITDPEVGGSVLARRRAQIQLEQLEGSSRTPLEQKLVRAAASGADLPLNALGGGSDYTPFLQHLGIATLDFGYGGEDEDAGIYHSAYDSFDHYLRFGDPTFAYEVALAQTAGHVVLRTADADILPLRFTELAAAVSGYVEEVEALLSTEREEGKKLQQLTDAGVFRLAGDPTVNRAAPPPPGDFPRLDFTALQAAAAHLEQSAQAYDAAFSTASESDFRLPLGELAELNRDLQGIEQMLTVKQGLPGREWYRHMLYAPGLYTGYGVKTLPAIREAIELHHWEEATAYLPIVAGALQATAARIDEARKQLSPRLGVSPSSVGTTPTPTPPPDY